MGLVEQVLGGISNFLGGALPFLALLTVVVFIHELGHFLVARWCGVKVSTFSIGFGREIAGFNDRHGTRWRLSWIPLGGYVKFMDDANEASMPSKAQIDAMSADDKAHSFHAKSLPQKSAILVAGPLANFLLAIVILAGMLMTVGRQITAARVDGVVPDSAAAAAGFKPGDIIVSINGTAIESFSDMQRIASTSADQELTFVVERGGVTTTLKATPRATPQPDGFGSTIRVGMLGIQRTATATDYTYKAYGPIEAVVQAVKDCGFIIARNLEYMGRIITRKESGDQLGGPIRIAEVSRQVAKQGFIYFLNLTAVISIGLGIMNLLPVPPLDGGHLLFYGLEAIRQKPMGERAQEFGFRVGLALVLSLMIFATWNDLGILKGWFIGKG
jgi:regulator of sigma E protease